MTADEPRSEVTAPAAIDPMVTWEIVVRALRHVLPYADIEDFDRAGAIVDEAGLDAAGLARLLAAVRAECGVVVPARDRAEVATFDGLCRYLAAHLSTPC